MGSSLLVRKRGWQLGTSRLYEYDCGPAQLVALSQTAAVRTNPEYNQDQIGNDSARGLVIEFWWAVPNPLDMVIHTGLRRMLPFRANQV